MHTYMYQHLRRQFQMLLLCKHKINNCKNYTQTAFYVPTCWRPHVQCPMGIYEINYIPIYMYIVWPDLLCDLAHKELDVTVGKAVFDLLE